MQSGDPESEVVRDEGPGPGTHKDTGDGLEEHRHSNEAEKSSWRRRQCKPGPSGLEIPVKWGWKGRTSQEEKWQGQRQGVLTIYGRLLGATGWAGNRFLFVAGRGRDVRGAL